MGKWKKLPDYEHSVFDESDGFVCDCETAAMADKIVRDHNAHEGLVEACKWASSWMESFTVPETTCQEEVNQIRAIVDAALAQAEPTN